MEIAAIILASGLSFAAILWAFYNGEAKQPPPPAPYEPTWTFTTSRGCLCGQNATIPCPIHNATGDFQRPETTCEATPSSSGDGS